MRNLIVSVLVVVILSFIVLNYDTLKSIVSGAHYLGHFGKQIFFDNGREIYVTELRGWF